MRFFRRMLLCLVVLAIMVGLAFYSVFRASQSVPEFYTAALELERDVASKAGDELEQQVEELHQELEQGSRWEIVVTAKQINGWLAADLDQRFPGLLPPEVKQPRVAFQDGETRVACRLETPNVTTVLSMALEPYLTETPNELAVRIDHVRAGRVPVPLKELLNQVSEVAMEVEVPLHWAQEDGDPVAIVQIPQSHEQLSTGVIIDTIRIDDGQLYIAGRSDKSFAFPQAGFDADVNRVANYFESKTKRQP
ncbi:MAG: hypothetical protein CMJ77_12750 [Planctomycetaceae bacterium]|nr:hypothetical protein [Planctomycetaceae bacterium]